jgi:hypothetical protein
VRVGIEPARRFGHAHALEQPQRASARLVRREPQMQPQRFGNLPANRVQRVERRHRLLEHHADAPPAQCTQLRLVQRGQFAGIEADRSGDPCAFGNRLISAAR